MKRSRILAHDDVLELLRSEVAKAGSQLKWAKDNGVSRPDVCRVLGGYRKVEPKILEALGLKKIDAYTWR
jgi:hypothetical protein